MKLVIVESPTKARTIGQFLGADYKVESSYGHVRDLPKSKLGIDVENNFLPQYIVPMKAKKNLNNLKKEAKKSDLVILATDEDREGEAIAWHLAQALDLNGAAATAKGKTPVIRPTQRIVFHEITKNAIEAALKNPREVDLNMVDAQQARRILDRLVGYKLSPFLWKKITGGLSAGRVQSVALRLVADRENEIRAFKPQEYWTISALLQKLKLPITNSQLPIIEAGLAKINGTALEKFDIATKEMAEKIVQNLQGCDFAVTKVDKKETKKTPPAPFTTSTLQQDSARRLRFSAKKTMLMAQRLYENGHITYMRTDSVNLSTESTAAAKAWLNQNLGAPYAAEAPRVFKSKSKLAQEAHEAIRPTHIDNAPDKISLTDEGEKRLYQLIWQRFMGSQMPHATVASTSIEISATNDQLPRSNGSAGRAITNYQLRASGQQIIFDGYLKIWPQKFEEKELPNCEPNETLAAEKIEPFQHFTEPPPRYSEASLIKTLEEFGIGRPSTYAPIISVIQTRNYVIKEVGRFKPTEIGELVNKVLTENFPEIVDIGFTAQMENELDEIASGEISWQNVIGEFYGPFAKKLEEKYEAVIKENLVPEKTDQVCELCGKPMIIKMGRFGKFMACSGFPECKNTKKLVGQPGQKEAPKSIGMPCPKCPLSDDPERKANPGDIVERRVSRGRARGKIFWGCSKYPKCDYASWVNPLNPDQSKEEKSATEPAEPEEKSEEKIEE